MSACWRAPFWLGAICLLVHLPAPAWSQPPPRGRVQVWQEQRAAAPCCGILGEVVRPGVYEMPADRVLLSDLVRQAGGPTDRASGNVRIIRGGRGGQQTFLAPDSRYEVLAGDIVVIDARRQFAQELERGRATQPRDPSAATPSRVPLVLVALVNVSARPVVVPIPAEEATLENLCHWLRQTRLPRKPDVIAGDPLRAAETAAAGQTWLTSGSVVIFEPGTIDARVLPPLPVPVNAAGVEHSAAATGALAASPAIPPAPAAARELPLSSIPTEIPAPPPSAAEPLATGPLFTANALSADALPEDIELDRSAAPLPPIETRDDRPAPSPPKARRQRSAPPIASPRRPAAESRPQKANLLGTRVAALRRAAALTVSVFGAAVLVFWWLSRIGRRGALPHPRPQPAPLSPAPPSPLESPLEALIHNRVRLIEEPFPFPARLQFHGRPITDHSRRAAASRIESRVDVARPVEETRGVPHQGVVASRPAESAGPRLRSDAAATGAGESFPHLAGPEQRRRAPRPVPAAPGLLDRVLANVKGDTR